MILTLTVEMGDRRIRGIRLRRFVTREMYFAFVHGDHSVRPGNDASMPQTIRLKLRSLYAIAFEASRICAQNEFLRVSVAPQIRDLPLQTPYSSSGDDTYAWGFGPISNISKLTLHNLRVQESPSCGPLLDVVAIKELFPLNPTKS
ncbi:hypothetical protein U1Q18_012022 [Sarracenia purpurea var. burkii]